eukprot:TRINITY_DN7390_c0_g1_i4.p1 TRINITY_DN7390_c0_g1~~TRINITY_DN7390_c0_g1_i4.p1  ORF type:complete len:540 (+),score=168.97 TRINITY_DN7390_c0_g1_i4:133-1752(+)
MMASKSEESSSSSSPSQTITKLEAKDILLNHARDHIRRGLDADEAHNYKEAVELYIRAADIISGVLSNETDATTKNGLRATMKEILDRAERVKAEMEEQLVEGKTDEATTKDEEVHASVSAEKECEVLASFENVQVYRTVADETAPVDAPTQQLVGTGTLCILQASEDMAVLQLKQNEDDPFQFPLVANVPCLCTAPGYYVFPMPGGSTFYGVVFPPNIPAQYITVFEKLLASKCLLRRLPGAPPAAPPVVTSNEITTTKTADSHGKEMVTTHQHTEIVVHTPAPQQADRATAAMGTVSSGIEAGASKLVEGIASGSRAIVAGATIGGEYLKSKLTPNETPTHVSPKVAGTLFVAGKLTPMCVTVSRILINSLAHLAEEIGSAVSDGIKSTNLGSKVKSSVPDGPRTQAAKAIGKSTVKAAVDIWEALEEAGGLLFTRTSAITVDVVTHKYGDEVGQATSDGLKVAGNVAQTVYNLDQMGVKKVAKRLAANTATKTFLEDGKDKASSQPAITNGGIGLDTLSLANMLLLTSAATATTKK